MVYFFLSNFHIHRADGSTRVLCYRSRALAEAGMATRWIAATGQTQIYGFDYEPVFEEWSAFRQQVDTLDHAANLYVTSWDEVLVLMRGAGLPASRCLLYAQSEDCNRLFALGKWSIAVSDYTKTALERQVGARITAVISNGLDRGTLERFSRVEKTNPGVCAAALTRDEKMLRAFEKHCRLPVTMLPMRPQTEFWQEVARYRFFLNYHRHEGFGLPVLEAMALGTVPVVLFKHGTTAFAHRGNCIGLMNNPVRAAKQVNKLSEAQYRCLQEGGFHTARQFDIHDSNRCFVDLVRQLLSAPMGHEDAAAGSCSAVSEQMVSS